MWFKLLYMLIIKERLATAKFETIKTIKTEKINLQLTCNRNKKVIIINCIIFYICFILHIYVCVCMFVCWKTL